MWLFAYGSIIFRPSFRYLERRAAFVRGFTRRFWQGSPDHRGVPGAPGRVATLVEDANAFVGGAAYGIDPEEASAILRELDAREIAGFERRTLPLLDAPGGEAFAEGVTWIATNDNPHFLGPLPEDEIAAFVATRRGPSGENRDYVLKLHHALVELGIDDPHVAAIARKL